MVEDTPLTHVAGTDGDDVVPVNDVTALVDRDQAVGVTVEGNPHVRTFRRNNRLQSSRARCSAALIDVDAVRGGVDHHDMRAGS